MTARNPKEGVSTDSKLKKAARFLGNIFNQNTLCEFPATPSGYRRILILANSFKEGGRCIAGLEYEDGRQPLRSMRYLRPVYQPEDSQGEIPSHFLKSVSDSKPKPLEIFDIPIEREFPEKAQPENLKLGYKKWIKRSSLRKEDLAKFLPVGWQSKGLCGRVDASSPKFVTPDEVAQDHRSLQLIEARNVSFCTNSFDSKKIRVHFDYEGTNFDLPLTDDSFSLDHSQGQYASLYLCVSLGVLWRGAYWRLVAGVVGE